MRSRWLAGAAFLFSDFLSKPFSPRIGADKPKTNFGLENLEIAGGVLFGTGFRGASTESARAAQLLHKSFCISLYIRLC
jgi:hypothetical protein